MAPSTTSSKKRRRLLQKDTSLVTPASLRVDTKNSSSFSTAAIASVDPPFHQASTPLTNPPDHYNHEDDDQDEDDDDDDDDNHDNDSANNLDPANHHGFHNAPAPEGRLLFGPATPSPNGIRNSLSSNSYMTFGNQSTPSKRRLKIDEIISPVAALFAGNDATEQLLSKDATSDSEVALVSKRGGHLMERNISRKKLVTVTGGTYITELRRLVYSYSGKAPTTDHPTLVRPIASAVASLKKDLTAQSCTQISKVLRNITEGEKRARRKSDEEKAAKKMKKSTRSKSTDDESFTPGINCKFMVDLLPFAPVETFGMRTLLLEDVWNLEENRNITIFFCEKGLPPRYYKRIASCLQSTQQGKCRSPIKFQGDTFYHTILGRVTHNVHTKDWKDQHNLGELCDMLSRSEGEQYGIEVLCPGHGDFGFDKSLLLSWNELFFFPQSVFVQADIPFKVNLAETFRNLEKNINSQKALFHRLVQELHVDRFSIALVVGVWKDIEAKHRLKAAQNAIHLEMDRATKESFNAGAQSLLTTPLLATVGVKHFCKTVSQLCLARIAHTFGKFNNTQDPILAPPDMRVLANKLQLSLPLLYERYMCYYGYRRKVNKASSSRHFFLEQRYSLLVLLIFIVDVRKANPWWLSSFAMIITGAQYASGHSDLAVNIPTFLGFSVSRTTMDRHLKPLLLIYEDTMMKSLSTMTHFMCVFDNLQKGRNIKFQFGGSCNNYVKATMRFFLEPFLVQIPKYTKLYPSLPDLTFINQNIPSPFGLPAFESENYGGLSSSLQYVAMGNLSEKLWVDTTMNPFCPSGTRVGAYVEMVEDCYDISRTHRFQSVTRSGNDTFDYQYQPIRFSSNSDLYKVRMTMNRLRRVSTTGYAWYAAARDFQQTVTRCWRDEPPPAEILPMPICVEDPTTKLGKASVIWDFLLVAKLLEMVIDKKRYCATEDYNSKWMYPFGDELSLRRTYEFFDDVMAVLDEKCNTFQEAYLQAIELRRVIPQIIPVGGDLHFRFAMLDTVVRLYRGKFLQPIQSKLGWKKLDLVDVTKTFQQAHELVMLVYDETDRIMRDVFIADYILRGLDEGEVDQLVEAEEDLALRISSQYREFLSKEMRDSTDWRRRFIANFVLLMRKYDMFCQSERLGDSIVQEHLTSAFLPAFKITGKKNYVSTYLRVMETQYNAPPHVLHQVRINRARKQRGGLNNEGKERTNTGMDDHMERLMPHMKKGSHDGTLDAWRRVSKQLIFGLKAKAFAAFYTKMRKDAEYELAERQEELGLEAMGPKADPLLHTKKTTKPGKRNALNRSLVTEWLVKAEIHEVVNDNPIDHDHFWKALDKMTSTVKGLTREKNDPRAERNKHLSDQRTIAAIQQMIEPLGTNGVAAETKSDASSDDDVNDDGNDLDLVDQDDRSVFSTQDNEDYEPVDGEDDLSDANRQDGEIDDVEEEELANEVGDISDDELNELDDEADEDIDEEEDATGGDLVPVTLGKVVGEMGKFKGTMFPFNIVATTDFMEEGRLDLLKSNLAEGRENGKVRKKREDYFLRQKLFERLESMEEDVSASFDSVVSVGNGTGPLGNCRRLFEQYKATQSSDNRS
jgi:hypothetical protein